MATAAAKLDELQLAEAIPHGFKRREPKIRQDSTMLQAFDNESLDTFLARARPSEEFAAVLSPVSQGSSWRWIWVPGPQRADHQINDETRLQCTAELRAIVDEWSDRLEILPPPLVPTEARKVSANMFSLAKRCNYGSGRLLLSVDSNQVDDAWKAVARATVQGKLGYSAKVSTRTTSDQHVLCVMLDCFWDEANVRGVLEQLSSLGLHVTAFKPDIFSVLRTHDLKALHLHSLLYNTPTP
ncbi:hypothetical protein DYB37_010370 [Aphanomyces astaci]|uniref:Uncharacterized protein n=1 Tax=Aphanomyces astaci TaxID=112090 RepID=A0A3L6VS75_APHAT|nr:hypothetical protein DYB35_009986 [Aphanomyces astaci]RHZ05854.1 hypothetical protein DYB37_010370 [Aphanomyces astaci]RLO11246.1 hypothetical protein DYB28_010780 [Aphanomyces astaci]